MEESIGPAAGSTWRLGFAIRSDAERSAVPGSVGSYTWSGAGGTLFWVDPAEKLVVVGMVQGLTKATYRTALCQLTYGVLTVSQKPTTPFQGKVPEENLRDYAGTYDFGLSTSAADKQDATGGVGIASAEMANDALKVTAVVEGGPSVSAAILR
jgi:CubicO group peptidase (beta-lactamase class C family)